jgi:menaquinol-cytochrome c reductase iron-sulfur subunit
MSAMADDQAPLGSSPSAGTGVPPVSSPHASVDGHGHDGEVADPSRRQFLTRVSLWLSGAIAGLVGIPVVGYLLGPLIKPPSAQWLEVGPVNGFTVGGTVLRAFSDISPLPWAGSTSSTAVYVQRPTEQSFRVFAVNCTHLGCPVNWLETAKIFLCPCHGGVYYGDGNVAAGPPQHPLYEYQVRVENDRLYVQTRPLPPAQAWEPPQLPRVTR